MSQRRREKAVGHRCKESDGQRLRQLLVWGGAAIVILGGAFWIALGVSQPEEPPPPELAAVETFEDMGVGHLAAGEPPPVYNSDPPTSGPHAATPAPCGIYRQPVSDVSQLHSMEHGAVVVQYDPDLPQDQIEMIEDIDWPPAAEVIVAPRPNNPAAVALTSWTRRLLLDEVDVDVITVYQREFGNQSPEAGAQCPFQVDERG
ncbi:MAG TPA: DUF3105 domain-containing protein [Acidimicrobiia bacterium]|nr:DUF3105 domain-containing protein [Acidimicrobiia bacterium]